jgi:ribose-phosphate pyrophosphokinase
VEYTINLDDGFGQCGDAISYNTSIFPAGEIWIKLDVPNGAESVRINSRCNSSNDLMRIIMTIDALHRRFVTKIDLFIPYFPYSRQDRVCAAGEASSVKVICSMLRSFDLNSIITYDIHSGVPGVLLDNLLTYDSGREVNDFIQYLGIPEATFALVCPDAGAVKRTQALYNRFPSVFETIVYCHKERVGDKVVVSEINQNIADMTAFVVDDICDGGATFEAIGRRLKERHVKESYLFVSHGIFSKSTYELSKYYKKIGTTNSIHDEEYIEELPAVKSFKLDY